jgi:hypothetical protein
MSNPAAVFVIVKVAAPVVCAPNEPTALNEILPRVPPAEVVM